MGRLPPPFLQGDLVTLLNQIKKLLGMDGSSSVNQVPPSRGERMEGGPSGSDGSSDMPADLPQEPETEPFEPKP